MKLNSRKLGGIPLRSKNNLFTLTISSILIAIGILVPMIMPKVIIGPASFTLGSHVALFLGIFISPAVALAVVLGTSLGFLLSSFPLVIVLRALSQVVFVMVGAFWIQKNPRLLISQSGRLMFALVTGLIHAACEFLVVALFFFSGNLSQATVSQGFFISVLALVGGGTFLHSLVDFVLALGIWQAVYKQIHCHLPNSAILK